MSPYAPLGLLAVAASVGCGAAPPPVEAEAPLAPVTVNVGPAAAAVPRAAAATQCTAAVHLTALRPSSPTCQLAASAAPYEGNFAGRTVDFTSHVGTVTAPCPGAPPGEVVVTFPSEGEPVEFRGTATWSAFRAKRTATVPFFGCDWRIVEEITGDLSGALTYAYREERIHDCGSSPCTATGPLAVER